MRYYVTLLGRTYEVDLRGPEPRVHGQPLPAELVAVPGTDVHQLREDGRALTFLARRGEEPGRWDLWFDGRRLKVRVVDERTRALERMTGGGAAPREKIVKAPMPGLVVKVLVTEGQTVRAGQGVIIVEAMKMENELKAPADGVVARVHVAPGQAVERNATLVVLE